MDRRVLVVTTALGVALACAADVARAQSSGVRDPSVPSLFEPHFDGDEVRPQRFRKPGSVTLPSSGAGKTGFDATHTRAKRKAKEMERKRARARAESLPPVVASGPDRTVATVFQRQESNAALRRRAANTAPLPLDATGEVAPRPVRRRFVEDDPFGPVGVRVGSFIVKPAVDIAGGYNSNPGQRLNGAGSSFEKVASELNMRSDWSRHAAALDLRGSYIWYNELENYSKPDLNLRARGRIDITRDTRAEVEGRFLYAADNPGDPNLPNDVKKPPLYTVSGGTVGLAHTFNRLELSLRGGVDRTAYGDAELNNGALLDLRDRNYDQYGLKLRASYETLPGVRPFVEYGADQRRHDRTVDSAGLRRDSDGQTVRVGTTFELSRYLVGEISGGLFLRDYKDPAFENLHGPLFDASLTYYATPLTTLRLDARTTVDETILPGVSGAVSHGVALQIDHAFRRWLIGTARFGVDKVNYEGGGGSSAGLFYDCVICEHVYQANAAQNATREDMRYLASAALIYKMTRDLHLKGEYRREWLRSNFSSYDYTSNIFTLGLRLQR